jgi:vacuolar-type H+-ATPase subunit I/STV1
MAKSIFSAILGSDDDEKGERDDEATATVDPTAVPRSIPDAWARVAQQNRRLEERLASLESVERQLAETAAALHETAKQQLEVLKYLGRFSEAAERRGREMEQNFRGVPDVLRTLPSATKEQAEKLSEIAARLYEKARDDTVNALKAAQAAHQKSIEDLIDKSLGASRRATWWAVAVAGTTVIVALWVWLNGAPAR